MQSKILQYEYFMHNKGFFRYSCNWWQGTWGILQKREKLQTRLWILRFLFSFRCIAEIESRTRESSTSSALSLFWTNMLWLLKNSGKCYFSFNLKNANEIDIALVILNCDLLWFTFRYHLCAFKLNKDNSSNPKKTCWRIIWWKRHRGFGFDPWFRA